MYSSGEVFPNITTPEELHGGRCTRERGDRSITRTKLVVSMFPKSRGARLKEMITPSIREGLQTKGYQLVGSHSAVKRCRWVLSSLRRHGGCYKHTFYGIESHRCMEATTSVACANRCTFCWRGSTHPNALKWGSFEADDPRWLVQQMVDKHLAKIIKPLKGAQVDDKSFSEALQPRHVALSLVGEPVMYPKMGEFLRAIHTPPYSMSTFLVTNGQHPEELANLPQVTQLYISIDASNAEELKKIDRPLFKDYWERLLSSLKAAAEKKEKQRKVARLTILKDVNDEDISGYAKLIDLMQADFIEVKGATFAGWNRDTTGLTMDNCPYFDDIIRFAQKLQYDFGGEYTLSAVHEHSCSALLVRRGLEQAVWIDFDEFNKYIADHYNREKSTLMSVPITEYSLPAPEWARPTSSTLGMDPQHTRATELTVEQLRAREHAKVAMECF
ncbi:hypothetical protein FOZ62_014402 [Perkinsus olseni]|uniref:Radical SAM core domain-containing protein n=1 Tax=Perkinsus olseni TaxID=32597 RepID=A0A7J6PSS8_PEROL|nr:hypothetical protein FOZ62_014402 [Perkinsus olseni]